MNRLTESELSTWTRLGVKEKVTQSDSNKLLTSSSTRIESKTGNLFIYLFVTIIQIQHVITATIDKLYNCHESQEAEACLWRTTLEQE